MRYRFSWFALMSDMCGDLIDYGDRDLISADADLMQDDFVGHPATSLNCFRSPRDLAPKRDDAVILIYFRSLPLPPSLLSPSSGTAVSFKSRLKFPNQLTCKPTNYYLPPVTLMIMESFTSEPHRSGMA